MEGYELEPVHATARPAAAPPLPAQVPEDRPCIICSYNLRGLDMTSRCPECGTSVERSLRGDVLYFSSPHYLTTLVRGVTLVIAGSIAKVLLIPMYLVVASVLENSNASTHEASLDLAAGWVNTFLTVLLALGWWLFSVPDPAIVSTNTGATPRKIVRITGIICAAGAVLVMVIEQSLALAGSGVEAFHTASTAIVLAAGIALYFASLLYVAWLAKRIPDQQVHDDARRLMWLGPLLCILLACLWMLGPLIAWILYILFLNQVRVALRTVLHEMDPL